MARFTHNEDFGKEGLLYQLDAITSHTKKLKNEFSMDSRALSYFNWILEKMDAVKGYALSDPRFNWVLLQSDMDKAYKQGKGLISGYTIRIDLGRNPHYMPVSLKYSIKDLKL